MYPSDTKSSEMQNWPTRVPVHHHRVTSGWSHCTALWTHRDGWLLSTAFDSLEESEPTPPDTWLPQSLHSALGLWEPRLVLPRTGALPSHVPVTSPLSKADAEVCSRCSAGTRGCRSSSSEMANTGTLMWSPSPGKSRAWPLSIWHWGEEEALETGSEEEEPGAFARSAVAERRPKHVPVNRGRRRLLVELRRRCLWAGCVRG